LFKEDHPCPPCCSSQHLCAVMLALRLLLVATLLLQTHQKLGGTRAEPEAFQTVRSAPEAAEWLGWGHRVSSMDLWSMQDVKGESLFARHMPDECFTEFDCTHTHHFNSRHFVSVNTWSRFYSDTFDIGASAGYRDIYASVDASLGYNADSSGSMSKTLSYAATSSQQKCYRLLRDDHCAYNKSNLQPAFIERVKILPKGSPYDVVKMEAWLSAFVERFGTHITLSSTHGALVQALTSTESSSHSSHACMDQSLCQKFGWVSPLASVLQNPTANLCKNASRCDNSTGSSGSEKSICVALGGDPTLKDKICQKSVPRETLENWLKGGDLSSGSSAYRYSFMPIVDFLTNVDFEYHEAAVTLEKAIEYSNCRMTGSHPLEAWTESGCKCARTCHNGGTLDESSCTCQCRGDAKHGWTGPTCEETYGSCQPGRGTWNEGAAARCPVNNVCASWTSGSTCRATDVCCASRVGTKCCQFGDTCHCGHTGCDCVR